MSRRATDEAVLPPSADDALVRAASEVVGGPLGRHAAPRALRSSPAGPLLVLGGTAVLVLSALTRSHCRATDWASPDQFTHACYSDVASRVASGTIAEQPPGAALLTRALAAATASPRAAFDLSVLVAGASLAVAVVALVLLARPVPAAAGLAPTARRPWSAAALALSPVLLVSGLVSLELVAVAGVALGLLAWARGRPAASGAALGLAATVDPLALAVLGATWVAAVVARRGSLAAASVVASLLALGAVGALWRVSGLAAEALALRTGGGALGAARAVAASWVPGWGGEPGYGSAWLLPSLPSGSSLDVPGWLVVAGAALGTAAAAAAVVVLARRWAALGPAAVLARAPALGLVAAVGALVVAPTVPVQSSLLLLPLVAASGLPWRDHLPWAVLDAAATTTTWLYIYGQQVPDRGAEPWVYALLLCLRLLATAWLAVAVVRQHRPPAPAAAEGPAGLWTTVGGLRPRR